MSLIGRVGDIFETPGEMHLEWKIQNFSTLSDVGYYESPVFPFVHYCWCLQLHPKGPEDNYECIAIFLERKGSNIPITVELTVEIMGKHCDFTYRCERFNITNRAAGWSDFLSRYQLQVGRENLLPFDTLTISCKLKSDIKISTKASLFTRKWNCCRDLRAILDAEDKKDFTFHLSDGCKQSVHKVILESRSDYFKKMFGDEWLESKTGEGSLGHIEGKTFKSVLSYLYSGDVDELDSKNMLEIYIAAHELQIEELKQLCTEYMKKSVSIDTVCDILLLGEKYEETELKEHSMKFFDENAEEVFETDEWEKLRKEKPDFAFNILQNVVVKKKKRKRIKLEPEPEIETL